MRQGEVGAGQVAEGASHAKGTDTMLPRVNSMSSWLAKLGVIAAMAIVLGVPLAFRPEAAREPAGAARVVIISPHNEQIRYEFARGFDLWHRREFGQPAVIDWRQPGGTAEIRKLLLSQYTDAVKGGRILPDGSLREGSEPMPYDLSFGGGTFEHGLLKTGVSVQMPPEPGSEPGAKPRTVNVSMSIPMGFEPAELEAWFGENKIGVASLYDPGDAKKNDPGQYWVATALTAFGIVFNRDALRDLGLPEPSQWTEMTDPRLQNWIALADPRQSGSMATTYESILNKYGWDQGWSILRRMSANARYFTASSLKVPLDVAQGQAAVGVAIDFYGRYQTHAFMRPGETTANTRVGYVDPPGGVSIDPDPISLLRGSANAEVARRFVRFVLSEEGQALWCFPMRSAGVEPRADDPATWGPERFELRRMPIRRVMFQNYTARMVDAVDLYTLASDAPNRGWRSAVGPMMGAFAIDAHEELKDAWKAIIAARQRGVSESLIAQAEAMLDAFPTHTIPAKGDAPAKELVFSEANYAAVRQDWRDAEKDGRTASIRLGYTAFFRENYRQIVRLLNEESR